VYEKLFAQAVLPAPVQVFGRELKTYSLGHELWFERQDLLPVTALNVSTAAFPAMSMAFLKDDHEDFSRKFSGILRQIFFLTIPIIELTSSPCS